MAYRPDGTADWMGMQRIVGRLAGRRGSFVMRSVGFFDGSKASGDWTIVADSGTDELEGISGGGTMEAPHGSSASYVVDYEL